MSINNSSREFIKEIKNRAENFYIIHYSCENLNDNNETLLPRITSIAVMHYATRQTVSFSAHSIAEELYIDRNNVMPEFDKIEKHLLEKFYSFLKERRNKFWIHWNMRNLTYGFEHIEHRYIILGGNNIYTITIEHRINLSDLLRERYGEDYADKNSRMKSLMNLNNDVSKDFLPGIEEVQAFKSNEFIRMHKSTLSKVGFFHSVINRLVKGTLKTASRGFGVTLDRLFESRLAKMIGLLATGTTIGVGIWQIYLWIK